MSTTGLHENGEAIPNSLYVVGGETHPRLTEAVIDEIEGTEQGKVELKTFSDSENSVRFDESVRGADVFIIQPHGKSGDRSVNDSIIQHGLMIQAAKKASAKRVIAVSPYLGYSRSDKKDEPRQAIGAKFIAQLLEMAGADRIMSFDLHSPQIQAFVDIPFDHKSAREVLVGSLRGWMIDKDQDEVVVVSPDAGRAKTNEAFAGRLGVDMALIQKRRPKGSASAEAVALVGDIRGKHCVIIDDMIDTAGTLRTASDMLVRNGARSVIAAATHGVLSGNAVENIQNSVLEKIIVTNSLPLKRTKDQLGDQLDIVDIAPLLGKTILAVYLNKSVSSVMEGGKPI